MIAQILFYLPSGRVVSSLKPLKCAEDGIFLAYTDEVKCAKALHSGLMLIGLCVAMLFFFLPMVFLYPKLLSSRRNLDDHLRYGFLYEVRAGFFSTWTS